MTAYACSNPLCPRREPVSADTAPTCYTCGRPMAPMLAMEYFHEREWEFFESPPDGFDRVNARLEPMRPTPVRSDFTAAALRDILGMGTADSRPRVDVSGAVPALYISLHDWLLGDRVELGPELSYPGYRRQRVERGADGKWPAQITLEFPIGTAICWARAFGVSHREDGDVLFWHEVRPHIYIDPVVIPRLYLSGLVDPTMTVE